MQCYQSHALIKCQINHLWNHSCPPPFLVMIFRAKAPDLNMNTGVQAKKNIKDAMEHMQQERALVSKSTLKEIGNENFIHSFVLSPHIGF